MNMAEKQTNQPKIAKPFDLDSSTPPNPVHRIDPIFLETPWCTKLFDDPTLALHEPAARLGPAHNDLDSFFSQTLATPQTIRAHVTLRPKEHASQKYPRVHESIKIFALGPLVSGHERVAHGGLVATLADEMLGVLVNLNDDVEEKINPAHNWVPVMTLSLKVTYRKPVPAPGIVLGRARLGRHEGRKRWITGTIEDGNGTVLSEAEALFIELKPKKANL